MKILIKAGLVLGLSVMNNHSGSSFVLTPEYNAPKEIPKLTLVNFYNELLAQGIESPEIVLRQGILETMWFKCTNCSLKYNNLFGFIYKKKYMRFSNWVKCVEYYKKWQVQNYKGGDYYAFLKKIGFATSENYNKYLKNIDVSKIIEKAKTTVQE